MKLKKAFTLVGVTLMLWAGVACSKQNANDVSRKTQVSQALEQAELQDVSVSEDRDKNTITLSGKLHSDEAKSQAGQIAQNAAGGRIIVNEISVQPVGAESEAKEMDSHLDDGIESNYKAALIEKGLDKEHIKFDAKNGVLTLKGSVKTPPKRQEAQQLAKNIPNVQQVLNQIEVKR
jgi:hyperosmotically inducible periplasmic protein